MSLASNEMHPRVLREPADVVAKPVSMIFEKSWHLVTWKRETLDPSLKKDRKEDPGNYQPLSLTSVPGKVMVQILLEALLRPMENRKVVQDNQHGCSKGKSCPTHYFCDGVDPSMDKGRAMDDIYLNFSKTFDMVSHNILLSKLERRI
ncbi:RNA-directed DNA polymerase from mobile element jockey-like protein [Willisornis vidua]|uniref:RNA-directed DNA polymerase from mobile element jockey-like protein n=1 Tax=Willisornis vidua TaxID=1566151 RepID=A0ABQ9D5X6_9PASS|nr:RNA-directed DNA polymerase from mobile element jockey-like protein [Willisornis vidua]